MLAVAGLVLLGIWMKRLFEMRDIPQLRNHGWIRRHRQGACAGGITALLLYLIFKSGALMILNTMLPGGGSEWLMSLARATVVLWVVAASFATYSQFRASRIPTYGYG